ncbi:hypothetical protein Pla110_44260 [Polystyrenella longa]|uniref:Uncharacterized protein n=1 Tax=Polystyrenella longa TaxID=2528007 RepID=A0A518CTW3_9PLAN|nr:hypothetical protein Pla110_44260 [Polystyrenella longa]
MWWPTFLPRDGGVHDSVRRVKMGDLEGSGAGPLGAKIPGGVRLTPGFLSKWGVKGWFFFLLGRGWF